jgi:DNA-binding PadR family transcriptional regulator
MTAAQTILGGRAAVLLTLLDGPARAVTLHDRIRARAGSAVAVTDGACRKALACLERDGLVAPLMIVGASTGFELTPAGRTEAELLRAAALALARPMAPVKIVEPLTSRTA